MARVFVRASSQYLERVSTVVSGAPFTMHTGFYSVNTSVESNLMAVFDKDDTSQRFQLSILHPAFSNKVHVFTQVGGASDFALSSTGYTINTWHTAQAVFAASNDRRAYLDGGNKGTSSVDLTPAGIDKVMLAFGTAGGAYLDGNLAESAIWDVALSDDEVADLGKWVSPLFIRPGNLVAYWPLIGSENIDWVGGHHLTPINSPTVGDHPPKIIMPTLQALMVPSGVITIEVPLGEIDLSGLVPTVKRRFLESAPLGEIDLEGVVPTVKRKILTTVPLGELDIEGLSIVANIVEKLNLTIPAEDDNLLIEAEDTDLIIPAEKKLLIPDEDND